MGRDRFPKQSLGSLYSRIKQSRVLMVGAGGIGCELLKNLVLTGFGEVHIIDLDTIDLSNLNRQFLFRHEHIKKSKALVAKETAGRFNPNVKLEAHHANIKDAEFTVDWFKGFNLVFNALDNLDARRHVNKMCLAAEVPLIESGTTGFNGQVQVIQRGKTECYDCTPKQTPKSFPVCTIRSTPSQPIHCIVWAKSYLFTEIFGTSEDDAAEFDHSEDAENAKEIENLRQESQALKAIRDSMGSDEFPRRVFEKVFGDDIKRLRSMEDMWKSRRPPEALDYDRVSQSASGIDPSISVKDQENWNLAENFVVFSDSLRRLSARLRDTQAKVSDGDAPPILSFDKDDVDTLDFVTASANLRSFIFGIGTKSKFDIKQMAGNIIPAIATTNAMTAGLCVLQAFHVMRGDMEKARMVFLTRSTERVISGEPLHAPNPDCPVCGVAQSKLVVDPTRATLNDLVESLLRLELGYGEEFSVNNEVGILYDPDLDDNLPKKLSDLGIKGDSFLTVVDEDDDNPRVNLVLSISEQPLPEDSKPVLLPEKVEVPRKPKAVAPAVEPAPPVANGVAHAPNAADNADLKRKRNASDIGLEDEQIKKRGKVAEETSHAVEEDLVVVEDSGNGAIVIDD
ncbi:putative ubiquitin-like activating enzyme [Xylona heveae TC161]|uniref:Ubiquitin-activating enzyme E1-like n=1 Tax=Xylona heveae (strain CBS 132557 / TC161) TaxID=1328760 RepID=A0A164ZRE0_XYLHT|nr:putative ubiquitin-like activating enzyme [Xylona heveae TC161]KZF19415.1 putative ubiquitin-like activating enzyme [Xylona heveae TC161]